MTDYLIHCITGPNLPASVLLLVIVIYWLSVIFGALDLDLFDFDLDMDGEPDSFLSAGFVGLRFMNVGNVPIMVWASLFGISLWAVSMLLWFYRDLRVYEPGTWNDLLYLVRNTAIAAVLTKLATQPMIPWFEHREAFTIDDLIGNQVVISSGEATPDFGQARFETGGAPMLLDVRTVDGHFAKGDRAEIVDYDPDTRTYLISKVKSEV